MAGFCARFMVRLEIFEEAWLCFGFFDGFVNLFGFTEGGDDFVEGLADRLEVALFFVNEFAEFGEVGFHFFRGGGAWVDGEDFFVRGFDEGFGLCEELLKKLLAWAEPGDFDGDVDVGLEVHHANHLDCEVIDADGFAHVEHKDFAAFGVSCGLEDEADGFGDGHEVADDVAVGDGDGAAVGDLLLEEGDDGAVAAEDVAEADGDVVGFAGFVFDLDDHLADALAGAHDVRGVDGFVGGDEDEALGFVFVGDVGEVIGAEDVVFDGFERGVFHEGDVLVRGGVKNDGGVVGFEEGFHAGFVADGADDGFDVRVGVVAGEFHLDVVEVVFVDVEDDEGFGVVGDDLAAKFGADGATAASDEDDLAVDEVLDAAVVEFDGVAREEVFDFHLAEGAEGALADDEVFLGREGADFDVRVVADFENLAALAGLDFIDGENNFVNVELFDEAGDVFAVADDADASDEVVEFQFVVINNTDDVVFGAH